MMSSGGGCFPCWEAEVSEAWLAVGKPKAWLAKSHCTLWGRGEWRKRARGGCMEACCGRKKGIQEEAVDWSFI